VLTCNGFQGLLLISDSEYQFGITDIPPNHSMILIHRDVELLRSRLCFRPTKCWSATRLSCRIFFHSCKQLYAPENTLLPFINGSAIISSSMVRCLDMVEGRCCTCNAMVAASLVPLCCVLHKRTLRRSIRRVANVCTETFFSIPQWQPGLNQLAFAYTNVGGQTQQYALFIEVYGTHASLKPELLLGLPNAFLTVASENLRKLFGC